MDELGLGDRLRFVGPCVVAGELFDLGRYPGMTSGNGRVVAELHAMLDVGVVDRLDEFEGYASDRPKESLYLRDFVSLIEPVDTQAWIYVLNHIPDDRPRVASGNWRAQLCERRDH